MSLNTVVWLSGSVAEAAVVLLLLIRHIWRNFPVFVIYSGWALSASTAAYVIASHFSSSVYLTFYLAEVIIDSVFLFGVLVELGWSLLRPIRASLSQNGLVAIAALIIAVGAVVWPFTTVPGTANLSREWRILLHLQQTVSILQIVVFLALLAFAQVLSIGWRDRELQIATGLGFSSLVGLAITMLQQKPAFRLQFNLLTEISIAAYLCSLLYWVVSFAQKEEKRREFTPQMQSMLLAVAGAARATRVALADSNAGIQRTNDQR